MTTAQHIKKLLNQRNGERSKSSLSRGNLVSFKVAIQTAS